MSTIRNRAHTHIANVRTLCDELEQMIRAADSMGPQPGWMHPLRYGQELIEKAVKLAATELGMVPLEVAPQVE